MKAKNGAGGVTKIKAAVKKLIEADKQRGLDTRLVPLDDAAAMKKLKSPPVTRPADPKQNKFILLGDPSIHPVSVPAPQTAMPVVKGATWRSATQWSAEAGGASFKAKVCGSQRIKTGTKRTRKTAKLGPCLSVTRVVS